MFVFVGLGNPGKQYDATRHNIGFDIVDLLLPYCDSGWEGVKFDSHFASGVFRGKKALFLKPQTFMNLSGQAVSQVLKFYKLSLDSLVVFHDDIDMEFGKVRAKEGGGHGGNNGVRNIIERCGSDAFRRIKVGVGRPQEGRDVSNWVLSKFSAYEKKYIEEKCFPEILERLEQIGKKLS